MKPFTSAIPKPRLAPVTKATVGAMIDDKNMYTMVQEFRIAEAKAAGKSVPGQYKLVEAKCAGTTRIAPFKYQTQSLIINPRILEVLCLVTNATNISESDGAGKVETKDRPRSI